MWIEVTVRTDGEGAEAVCEFFHHSFGQSLEIFTGIEAESDVRGEQKGLPVLVKLILPAGRDVDTMRRTVEEGLWHLGRIRPLGTPQFRALDPEDLADAGKNPIQSLRIGERLVFRPGQCQWEAKADEVVLELNAGSAFGIGYHPSTRLCLLLLESHLRPGMEVLDLGSGSGILSLAAAGLGAARVDARDIDPTAVEATRENAERNGMASKIQVVQGSLPKTGSYNLILCNILAETTIDFLKRGLADRLAAGGIFIASGLFKDQADEVQAAMTSRGFQVLEKREEGDWLAVAAIFLLTGTSPAGTHTGGNHQQQHQDHT